MLDLPNTLASSPSMKSAMQRSSCCKKWSLMTIPIIIWATFCSVIGSMQTIRDLRHLATIPKFTGILNQPNSVSSKKMSFYQKRRKQRRKILFLHCKRWGGAIKGSKDIVPHQVSPIVKCLNRKKGVINLYRKKEKKIDIIVKLIRNYKSENYKTKIQWSKHLYFKSMNIQSKGKRGNW